MSKLAIVKLSLPTTHVPRFNKFFLRDTYLELEIWDTSYQHIGDLIFKKKLNSRRQSFQSVQSLYKWQSWYQINCTTTHATYILLIVLYPSTLTFPNDVANLGMCLFKTNQWKRRAKFPDLWSMSKLGGNWQQWEKPVSS